MENLQKYIGFLLRNTSVGGYTKLINITYDELERLGIKKNHWRTIININEIMSASEVENGLSVQLRRYPFTEIYNL